MPLNEMEMLLAAGLTPMEIIEAGTRIAAAACGQGDSLGTLEPGKLADVIVVDGDPLEDLAVMEDVVLVILGGEIGFSSLEITAADE
jgi:imidazolonepropionase-like amidohydrolase